MRRMDTAELAGLLVRMRQDGIRAEIAADRLARRVQPLGRWRALAGAVLIVIGTLLLRLGERVRTEPVAASAKR